MGNIRSRTFAGIRFICQRPGFWESTDSVYGIYQMLAGTNLEQWEVYRNDAGDDPIYGELIGTGLSMAEAVSDAFMSRKAFTLVELMVCVASLGLLASLLLPAAQAARDASRRVQCQSNLHQIWLDVSSRMGAKALITEPSEKSIMQCPAIRESGQGDPQYVYEHAGATRQQLIEHFGRDSIDIAIAFDSRPAHGDVQLGLFLDGHVRALRDGDAK